MTRGIAVRMRDGVILRADHYAPDLPGRVPTVLVRTPYGRGGVSGWLCRAVALRGFHVVIQSCRGTGGSGGAFDPMVDERDDGIDTVEWLARQPWYDGRLCTYGPSYVGFVQWALADAVGDQLKAMSTIVTASSFGDSTYAGGAFSLDSVLTWSALLSAQRGPWLSNAVELLRGQPRLQRGLAHLPLAEADRVATGAEVEFFQRWLVENDPTPALGGPRLVGKLAGRRDNAPLEARGDVRTFTTAPLTHAVEAIGPVTASIRVRASGKHFDLFVRLCDVDRDGRSWNVCDGLTRVSTVDEDGTVRVALWPTAYRFRAGHRIRLQVSGGAHPRFARNPGTGAGLGESTELLPVHLEILPSSALELPITR